MQRHLCITDILERLGNSLALEPVRIDPDWPRPLPTNTARGGFPTLVGHLNLVQPNRLQILGPAEIDWWHGRAGDERRHLLGQLLRTDLFGLIVTDGLEVPVDIARAAAEAQTPLLRSTQSGERVVSTLRHFLGHELAERTVLHGVFIDVLGTGVLLTGDPALGKSELALELISRGHSLVADDAPEFSRPSPDTIEGEADPLLKDFLEVRGLGVLNVRAMYGDTAIRHHKRLQLVIHLEPLSEHLDNAADRVCGGLGTTDILGLAIPAMTLPVAPGRNLAVLVEAAVRNSLLVRRGYSAGEDLTRRQEQALREEQA